MNNLLKIVVVGIGFLIGTVIFSSDEVKNIDLQEMMRGDFSSIRPVVKSIENTFNDLLG